MTGPKLSDTEVYDAIHAAWLAVGGVGGADGETVRGNTAIHAARRALMLLQLGLLMAIDENSDRVKTVKDPEGA